VEKGLVWLMTLHFMFVYAAKTFLDLQERMALGHNIQHASVYLCHTVYCTNVWA
jgi:hypothetical protein